MRLLVRAEKTVFLYVDVAKSLIYNLNKYHFSAIERVKPSKYHFSAIERANPKRIIDFNFNLTPLSENIPDKCCGSDNSSVAADSKGYPIRNTHCL